MHRLTPEETALARAHGFRPHLNHPRVHRLRPPSPRLRAYRRVLAWLRSSRLPEDHPRHERLTRRGCDLWYGLSERERALVRLDGALRHVRSGELLESLVLETEALGIPGLRDAWRRARARHSHLR